MSLLLYLHMKNNVFSISFPFPLHQAKVSPSLVNFLTARKRERQIQKTKLY